MSPSSGPKQSGSPSTTAEGSSHTRLLPSSASSPEARASSDEGSEQDFLFHLYRGSELLQESRVLEAREELEFALSLRANDPKGQDLLGAVYFRLGEYLLATQIYESLVVRFHRDTAIKTNLGICYLKTGQPELAQQALSDAVRLQPENKRAWGYLALALQKLGELEQAQLAFERGGHTLMAGRMQDMQERLQERGKSSMPSAAAPAQNTDASVRAVAETLFSELDAGERRFALAEAVAPRPVEGPWRTLSLGIRAPAPREGTPDAAASAFGGIAAFAFPEEGGMTLHESGVLLADVRDDRPFATRLEALRVAAGAPSTRVLHRRARDKDTSEVLGGLGSPLVRVSGSVRLILAPRAGLHVALLPLREGLVFLREELVLAFELHLTYENGKLPLEATGEGARPAEGTPIMQLRGTGTVALETPCKLASMGSAAGRELLVRREWVAGWMGRLVPRALSPAESPSGQRGLLSFSGDGSVLLCPESR